MNDKIFVTDARLTTSNAAQKRIIIVSPHTKVELTQTPTEGIQHRVVSIVKMFLNKIKGAEVTIVEPKDLKEDIESETNIKRVYFEAFSFIKIKVMRLGSYFLNLNPFYLVTLARLLKSTKPDIILVDNIEGTFSTYMLSKKVLKLNPTILQISHNVESEYIKFALKDVPIPKILKWFFVFTRTVMESLSLKYSDYVLAISRENKKMFISKYKISPEKIVVVPPRIDARLRTKTVKKSKNQIWAVFHGIYRTIQNREAIEIIKNMLAKRFKKYKNFKFIVFGKDVPTVEENNFKSLGFVENVNEFLSSCDIAVVPLVSGEGVKIKMLDYMAVGLPIVTTKKGAEGLDLVNGKHAIIVEDVNEEFIKAIEYLVENPKMRRKLEYNARKLFERKYKM